VPLPRAARERLRLLRWRPSLRPCASLSKPHRCSALPPLASTPAPPRPSRTAASSVASASSSPSSPRVEGAVVAPPLRLPVRGFPGRGLHVRFAMAATGGKRSSAASGVRPPASAATAPPCADQVPVDLQPVILGLGKPPIFLAYMS